MKVRSLLAAFVLWLALALGSATPVSAQASSGEYRAELNQIQLDMRALWGEIERFEVQRSYCQPPYAPIKQPDEMVMIALSQRADALNARYIELKTSLIAFLGGNNRLAAELMLNGSDPFDREWWRRYDEGRDRMLQERNRKRDALARAPVRNCAPTPQQQPQVEDTPAPTLPQPPTYAAADFPTVPRQFCSEAEYWRFINEVIDPPYIRAAENAEKAAKFRTSVEVAINDYVQAGKPVPAALRALRQRAQREVAERDRLSDEIAKLRDRARRTPIVDCSKKENTAPRIGTRLPNFPMPHDMNGKLWRVYSEFEDARERCDRAAMAAAIAELEQLAREARDAFSGAADMLQGGPFDQEETPENMAYWSAEADLKAAERMLAGARAQRAKACPPCSDPPLPPATSVASAPASSAVNRDAAGAVAQWVVETDRLFDSMAQATQARDCARIKAAMTQIAQRFGGPRRVWWAVGVPLEILVKWKWLYIRAAEACRPPADEPESILDQIEEVPVIAMTTAPNAFAQAFLDYHNRLRAEVGAPPLRWNPILAAHAAAYALVMTQTGQLLHSTRQGREKERENLTLGRHGTSTPTAMMQTWGQEKKLFTPGLFPQVCAGDWSTCAHYTQMVWSTTTDVGCGYATGKQYDALVCRYSPPGNADGKPVILPADQLAILRQRCLLPPLPPPPPPPP